MTYSVITKSCSKTISIGKTFWKSIVLPAIMYLWHQYDEHNKTENTTLENRETSIQADNKNLRIHIRNNTKRNRGIVHVSKGHDIQTQLLPTADENREVSW